MFVRVPRGNIVILGLSLPILVDNSVWDSGHNRGGCSNRAGYHGRRLRNLILQVQFNRRPPVEALRVCLLLGREPIQSSQVGVELSWKLKLTTGLYLFQSPLGCLQFIGNLSEFAVKKRRGLKDL